MENQTEQIVFSEFQSFDPATEATKKIQSNLTPTQQYLHHLRRCTSLAKALGGLDEEIYNSYTEDMQTESNVDAVRLKFWEMKAFDKSKHSNN